MNARTLREAAGPVPYDIGLPEAGLHWEKMGPLFERYSVALVGSADLRWAETYALVASAPGLGRFRLATDHASVSFTCRAADGPVEVMAVLKILEGMIERVNREASLAAAGPPAVTGSGARPHRGGLFSRSAAHSK